jgi:hypothetical protein
MKYTLDTIERTITISRMDDETLQDIMKDLEGYEDYKILFVAGSLDIPSNPRTTNPLWQAPHWTSTYGSPENPYTVTFAGDTKTQLIVEDDKTTEFTAE